MLESITKVNWRKLKTCYGSARDFPEWFAVYMKGEQNKQDYELDCDFALEGIMDEIIHQGTLYEATPYAARVFVEMLPLLSEKQQCEILGRLCTLGLSGRQGEFSLYFAPETCLEIQKGMSIYTDLLSSPNVDVRMCSVAVLSTLYNEFDSAAKLILTTIENEKEIESKFAMVSGLREMLVFNRHITNARLAPYITFFEKALNSIEHPYIHYQAACTLPFIKPQISENVLQVLKDALINPQKYDFEPDTSHRNYVFWTSAYTIAEVFCAIQKDLSVKTLADVLPQIKEPDDAQVIAKTLLDFVFYDSCDDTILFGAIYSSDEDLPKKSVRDIKSLSDEQLSILQLVISVDVIWERDSNLMTLYDLPSSREELHQLIK